MKAKMICNICKKEFDIDVRKSPIESAKENDMILVEIEDLKNEIKENFFICKDCYKRRI